MKRHVFLSNLRRSLIQASACLPALALVLASAGCSLSMFTGGDGFDQKIQEQTTYRKPNLRCVGLDLSSATIDVPTFRRLTDCFNSQGALEPIARLVQSLSDAELSPIVGVINESLLNNSVRLFDLESTFNRLIAVGILDASLDQFGRLLENTAFVESGVRLLDQAYQGTHDDLFVRVLSRLSSRVQPHIVLEVLELGITLARTSSFQELQVRLRGDSPGARELRRDILEPMIQLLRENRYQHGRGVLGSPLAPALRAIQDGRLFSVLDARLGVKADEIRARVPVNAAAFGTLGRRGLRGDGVMADAAVLDDLTSLFHATMGEIRCFKGTQRVERANLFIVQELIRRNDRSGESAAEFLRRTIPLTLTAIRPFCDYPPELGRYYPSLSRLAETTAIAPVTELLVEMDHHDLTRAIIDLLGATGSGMVENRGGVKHLLPFVAEVSDRRIWDDLLYLVTSIPEEKRPRMGEVLAFLLEPLDEGSPEGPAILDGMIELGARVQARDLESVIQSMKVWLDGDEQFLDPIFSKLREAYFVNDVHPVVGLLHDLLERSSKVPRLCETLLGIAKRPEFSESVRLVSAMLRDGRLRELASSLLTLFHKFAANSEHPVAVGAAPVLVEHRRHDWSSRTVPLLEAGHIDRPSRAKGGRSEDPCLQLQFATSIDQSGVDARVEFELFALCIGTAGNHQATADILRWMRDVRLNGSSPSLFEVQVQLLSVLGNSLSEEQLRLLTNTFISCVDDRRVHRFLHAIPLLTETKLSGGRDDDRPATVAESAITLIRELILNAQSGLRTMLNIAAGFLRDPEFVRGGRHLVHSWRSISVCDPESSSYNSDECDLEPEIDSKGLRRPLDGKTRANLADWLQNWECTTDPARIDARIRGVWKEYQGAVNSWELVEGRDSQERRVRVPRMEWNREDFHAAVDPLIKGYQDLSGSVSSRTAMAGTSNLIRYFNLGPGELPNRIHHFDRDGLFKWLRDRADDYRPIAYIYPGETRPRVRLLSTIERFELLLWNANVQFLLPENMGFQFLQRLGEAWGDDLSDVWPTEILSQYGDHEKCDQALTRGNETARRKLVKQGRCPMTLQDVWERDELFPAFAMSKSMKSTMRVFEFALGMPVLPNCQQKHDVKDPGAVIGDEWRARSSGVGLMPEDVRVRIFNIKQLLSVVPENLPGAPPAADGTDLAGGLKVLRNLFFELLYSSPEKCRNARALECNNLDFVPLVIQNGLLRKVVQKLREFAPYTENEASVAPDRLPDYLKVRDFFRGMGAFTDQPGAADLLQAVVGRDPSRRADLFDMVVDRLFDMAEAADPSYGVRGEKRLSIGRASEISGLDQRSMQELRSQWVREERRMRKLALDFVAFAQRTGLIPTLVPIVNKVVSEHAGTLADQKRLLLKTLRSQGLAHLIGRLVEGDLEDSAALGRLVARNVDLKQYGDLELALNDILRAISGPGAVGSASTLGEGMPGPAELLVNRAIALGKLPSFQQLELGDLISGMVDTLLAVPSEQPEDWVETSRVLRLYVADRLQAQSGPALFGLPPRSDSGDLENLLALVALDPARFQELLEVLGRSSHPGGELESFIELARRSLQLPASSF